MNYLAHARLSFNYPGVLTGNLISDFVKGKKRFDYPSDIQMGISLHRSIDTFTDAHEATRAGKEVFRPAYRLYAGAFMDVVYDHFLANDPIEFPGSSLADFSKKVYASLEAQQAWFPSPFTMMFPHMKAHDWLFNCRTMDGTGRSFGGLVHRSAYLTESDSAREIFAAHYQLFQECYRQFWVAVKPFARAELDRLLETRNV